MEADCTPRNYDFCELESSPRTRKKHKWVFPRRCLSGGGNTRYGIGGSSTTCHIFFIDEATIRDIEMHEAPPLSCSRNIEPIRQWS